MDIIATLKNYIVENFLFGDDSELTETVSFLEKNIIDSTGILELVSFLEETFNITVNDDELLPENLDSLINVEVYINKKLNENNN